MTVAALTNSTLWCTCATYCDAASHASGAAAGAVAPKFASSVPTAVGTGSTGSTTTSSYDQSVAQRMAGADIACSSATNATGATATAVEPPEPVGFTLATDVDLQLLAWCDGKRARNPASV